MEQNIDFIENIQNEMVKNEKIFNCLTALNKFIKMKNEFILYVNIRSLNANHTKLQIFVESLEVKPSIVVCSETRVGLLEYYKFFSLPGYKMYYNHSRINISDGVVIYIQDNIIESTEIIKEGKLSILNSSIVIDNNKKLVISAIYRSHDLPKTEFI